MNIKHNIPIIYITSSLTWGRFFVPVLALFYIASQVPIEQFAIIMSIFALSILVLEIPSGVITDLLGKKKALLLSRFFYIIEIVILVFFNGFWPFLIAKTISGVGVSLSSGTNSGLLYDTLKRLNREKENKKIYGSIMSVQSVSMGIVFIIGAYLFSIDPKLPAVLSLPFVIATFILTFLLTEPYKNNKKINFTNTFNHLKESLAYVRKNNFIKFSILYYLSIISITSITLSLSSAYFEAVLIPISLMGIVAFIAPMIAAAGAKKAHSFEDYFGKKSFIIISLIAFLGLFFMSFTIAYIGVLFFFLIAFAGRITRVLVSNNINEKVKTSHRVTILSINNMGSNLAIFLLFPITGFLIKDYSMSAGFSFLTLFFVAFSVLILIYSMRIKLHK